MRTLLPSLLSTWESRAMACRSIRKRWYHKGSDNNMSKSSPSTIPTGLPLPWKSEHLSHVWTSCSRCARHVEIKRPSLPRHGPDIFARSSAYSTPVYCRPPTAWSSSFIGLKTDRNAILAAARLAAGCTATLKRCPSTDAGVKSAGSSEPAIPASPLAVSAQTAVTGLLATKMAGNLPTIDCGEVQMEEIRLLFSSRLNARLADLPCVVEAAELEARALDMDSFSPRSQHADSAEAGLKTQLVKHGYTGILEV